MTILTSHRNIGVLQTTVAEVVTVEAHQGQRSSLASIGEYVLTTYSTCIFDHAIRLVPWVGLPLMP